MKACLSFHNHRGLFTKFLLGHGRPPPLGFPFFNFVSPLLFLLFSSFCYSDWFSTGLASSSKNLRKRHWDGQILQWSGHVKSQTILLWAFQSNFWAFSCICKAPLSQSLWSGHHWKGLLLLQNLNTDDANFGQRWWRHKRNKGERPTRQSMVRKAAGTKRGKKSVSESLLVFILLLNGPAEWLIVKLVWAFKPSIRCINARPKQRPTTFDTQVKKML